MQISSHCVVCNGQRLRPALPRNISQHRAQSRASALPFWHLGHHSRRGAKPVQTAPAPSPVIQHVTASEMLAKVQAHTTSPDKSVDLVVMFTAAWCGPCAIVHKELVKLGALREGRKLQVLALDHDSEESKQLATDLGIASLPTLIFIGTDAHKPAISTVGLVSSSLVADVLDNKMKVCGADLRTRLRLS